MKNTSARTQTIKIPIIPYQVTVFVFDNEKSAKEEFPHKDLDRTSCLVFEEDGLDNLLIIKEKATAGTIVHECNHILNRAFDWIGQELDKNNDELQSYFLQYIFEEVMKVYENEK